MPEYRFQTLQLNEVKLFSGSQVTLSLSPNHATYILPINISHSTLLMLVPDIALHFLLSFH